MEGLALEVLVTRAGVFLKMELGGMAVNGPRWRCPFFRIFDDDDGDITLPLLLPHPLQPHLTIYRIGINVLDSGKLLGR
jgi:hypothetical protein